MGVFEGKAVALFVLLGLASTLLHNLYAGSAVAWDGHGHLVHSAGYPIEIAKERALRICRVRYGASARLLASTDVVGDGAIAVARRGAVWVVGISLGRPSPADAENRAIEKCIRAGGINPKVRWGFRG
jgi:hypothetical protein